MASEFNPFTSDLMDRIAELDKVQADKLQLSEEQASHRAFDPDVYRQQLKACLSGIKGNREKLSHTNHEIYLLNEKAKHQERITRLLFNPLRYFSSSRSVDLRVLAAARENMEQQIQAKSQLEKDVVQMLEVSRKLQASLDWYHSFSPDVAESKSRKMSTWMTRLTEEVASLSLREQEAEALLGPHQHKLDMLREELSDIDIKIETLVELDGRLTQESSKYKKRQIHEHCEEVYKESSPATALRKTKSSRPRIDSSIKKLEIRMQCIAKRISYNVQSVVVDGSNLCFQQDSFIGLSALKALIPMLSKKYRVTLVFDASLWRTLKPNEKKISENFGSSVDVRVARHNEITDEIVLDLAEFDNSVFVISNDNFAEYTEKRAVIEGRIISHVIENEVISVQGLNLRAPFSRNDRF